MFNLVLVQGLLLLLRPLSLRPQSSGPWSPDRYACSPPHGPRATAPGPLLKGRETRFTNGMTVSRLVLLQQPAANQQPDATLTDLDRRDHDHAPGAALAEASCTDGGCRFMGHVTGYYYDINGEFCPTFGYEFGLTLFGRNPVQGPISLTTRPL